MTAAAAGRATVGGVVAAAGQIWNPAFAESWDNPGLAVGDLSAPVTRILFALDVTHAVLEQAADIGANLVFSHHPVLFHPAHDISTASMQGALIYGAAARRIALFSAHTNADSAPGGVNDVLADLLGVRGGTPLETGPEPGVGIGRVGVLEQECSLAAFGRRIAEALPPTAAGVLVQGDPQTLVRRVALCSGAGDSLLSLDAVGAADVYVTADLRHHPALDVAQTAAVGIKAPALVCVSHWASESVWLPRAAAQLKQLLPSVEMSVGDICTDPWTFRIGAKGE